MAELENDEVNRELCQIAVEDMFESWSPETQEAVLAEWNDWQQEDKSGYCCDHSGKKFTRSNNLKRYIRQVHTGKKPFRCLDCDKSFASSDKLKRHEKIHQEKSYACQKCGKKFGRRVCK